jgi:hypothetical protein
MQGDLHKAVYARLPRGAGRKNRVILAGATLALVIIGGSALPFLRPSAPLPPRFTKQMAEAIREGMTEAEAVVVLSRPPGWYASPDTSYLGSGPVGCLICPEGWQLPNGDIHKGWISDAGAVCVQFGKDGRVVSSLWGPVSVRQAESGWPFLRRLRRWLSL